MLTGISSVSIDFSNKLTFDNKLDALSNSSSFAAAQLFQGKSYDGLQLEVWSLRVI